MSHMKCHSERSEESPMYLSTSSVKNLLPKQRDSSVIRADSLLRNLRHKNREGIRGYLKGRAGLAEKVVPPWARSC